MKKLLKYLREYRLESFLGPLFKLLEASFELMVPLVMAKVIDVGIKTQDLPYILKMGGILVLLGWSVPSRPSILLQRRPRDSVRHCEMTCSPTSAASPMRSSIRRGRPR